MTINFKPLCDKDFTVLLSWLKSAHVSKWWNQDINYIMDLAKDKQPSIYAFIIYSDDLPIGYIQYYNAYDFSLDKLIKLPQSIAELDMFIGDKKYLEKDITSKALKLFLVSHVYKTFRYALVEPATNNLAAVRSYEKSGFVILNRVNKKYYMVAAKKIVRLSALDSIALEIAFRKIWLENDSLWVFGSRADLSKKGGGLDLYVKTHALTIDDAFAMKQNFLVDLSDKLGEQKIDVVLNVINSTEQLPIYEMAEKEGVRLI